MATDSGAVYLLHRSGDAGVPAVVGTSRPPSPSALPAVQPGRSPYPSGARSTPPARAPVGTVSVVTDGIAGKFETRHDSSAG